jgi:hypothetical protein
LRNKISKNNEIHVHRKKKKLKKMVISDVKIKWQLNQTPEERKTFSWLLKSHKRPHIIES